MKPAQYLRPANPCQPGLLDRVYGFCDRNLARIFRPNCMLCLDPGQPGGLDLCAACEADLVRDLPACTGCAAPLPRADTFLCAGCLREQRDFDAAFVPYRYQFPLDRLIQRMKYQGEIAGARVLGTLLGRVAARAHPLHVQALLPVPLHRSREAGRGFNQALEIARYAGRETGLPVVLDACQRIRSTAAQTGLTADERRGNLRGAFALVRRLEVERVAVVDDVMTTGSTVEELARLLKADGASWVEAWAVARA